MLSQDLLGQPAFSIWLNTDASQPNAGQLIFGGSDPSLYVGATPLDTGLSARVRQHSWRMRWFASRTRLQDQAVPHRTLSSIVYTTAIQLDDSVSVRSCRFCSRCFHCCDVLMA